VLKNLCGIAPRSGCGGCDAAPDATHEREHHDGLRALDCRAIPAPRVASRQGGDWHAPRRLAQACTRSEACRAPAHAVLLVRAWEGAEA
jgi:hypothetical protein